MWLDYYNNFLNCFKLTHLSRSPYLFSMRRQGWNSEFSKTLDCLLPRLLMSGSNPSWQAGGSGVLEQVVDNTVNVLT